MTKTSPSDQFGPVPSSGGVSQNVWFVVPGNPAGKARPRMSKTGHVYTPSGTRQREKEIAALAKEAMTRDCHQRPFSGPVEVRIVARYPIPKSFTKAQRAAALKGEIFPTVKPDFDNVQKMACDAMNGVVYADDKQVCSAYISKRYGENPGMTVCVTEFVGIMPTPSKGNEDK